MKYAEFKNGLENGQEYAVYLFEGEDAYFRENGVILLKNAYISQPELNFVNLPSDSSVGELLSSLEGYPFMSKKRMTLIREFYPNQDYFNKGLKEYLENPFMESVLVIVNEKSFEQFKKYKCICTIDCNKADASLLVKWIKAECLKEEVAIDGQTASLLSEYCLSEMTRIKTETDKLIDYVGKGGTILKETIDLLVARDLEYKIYELTDYIASKNFSKAISLINDMTAKGEPAIRLLSSIYKYFRRLLHVAIADMSIEEMAKSFGVKEFAVKKMQQQASKFKKRALKNVVDLLCDADYKIKSGLAEADDYSYLSIFKIMME